MKIAKDLVAASSAPIVLSILREGENYGYAIVQRVYELSDGEITWTDGMLYPVLHRLEELGYIESSWSTADSGRKRKYYRLTPDGRAALREQKEQWQTVFNTLGKFWRLNHV